MSNNIKECPIEEFHKTGLLLFVNQFLHIFGWALVIEMNNDGSGMRLYPSRCKYRGFSTESTTKAYINITKHIEERLPQLLDDVKEL